MQIICDICKKEKKEHQIFHPSLRNFILEHYPELKKEKQESGQATIRLCHSCFRKVEAQHCQEA